jgi:excisionase family DNA binding protein
MPYYRWRPTLLTPPFRISSSVGNREILQEQPEEVMPVAAIETTLFKVGDYVRIRKTAANFGGWTGRVARVGKETCMVWPDGYAGDCMPFLFEDLELVHRPAPLKAALTVQEAAELLGVSRGKAYEMTRRPGFPCIRDGRRIIIPRDALLRWMDEEARRNTGEPCGATHTKW